MKKTIGILSLLGGALLLSSASAFAVSTRCTTDELDLMCPEGQILRGIASDGTISCEVMSAVPSCLEGEVYSGLDAEGNPVCLKSGFSGVTVRTDSRTEWRWPSALAECEDEETLVGGGGSCETADGWMVMTASHPEEGNKWRVRCDIHEIQRDVTAKAYAICAGKNVDGSAGFDDSHSTPVVNGACRPQRYQCAAGTSTNQQQHSDYHTPTYYTWTCEGSNGGTDEDCMNGQ